VSTEDHAEVAVVLDMAPGPETATEVVGYSRTEISTAAHALRKLLGEQSATLTGSDHLFNHEGRSMAFSEYVAILHDPEVLNDPWTDIAVGQSAANTRDALRAEFDMSAPSGLNETQRRAAIEYISGRLARELAYAADAQPNEALPTRGLRTITPRDASTATARHSSSSSTQGSRPAAAWRPTPSSPT
jgi:hypothetical protein